MMCGAGEEGVRVSPTRSLRMDRVWIKGVKCNAESRLMLGNSRLLELVVVEWRGVNAEGAGLGRPYFGDGGKQEEVAEKQVRMKLEGDGGGRMQMQMQMQDSKMLDA